MKKKTRFTPGGVDKAPKNPGVYEIFQGQKRVYIGSARDIQNRLEGHLNDRRFKEATSFRTTKTKTTQEARKKERAMIDRKKPPKNKI